MNRPVLWMTVGAVGSWAVVAGLIGGPAWRDIGLGMAGPLAGAIASWFMIVRTLASDPARLTGRMIVAFGAKMVFFAAYIVWAVRGLAANLVPFAVSFASYFIALHLVEAMVLRRVLRGPIAGTGAPAAVKSDADSRA